MSRPPVILHSRQDGTRTFLIALRARCGRVAVCLHNAASIVCNPIGIISLGLSRCISVSCAGLRQVQSATLCVCTKRHVFGSSCAGLVS